MKKFYIILFIISFSNISFSQTTLIPDANFEQKLIDLGIDTNGLTGDILNTDAQSVTILDVSNSSITDLTGIKTFTALTSLDCSDNTLSSLNVFEINGLLTLYCNNNNLTELFFNDNLTQLLCHFNSLTHLDLRLNTGLSYLDSRNNNLYSLNLANGNNAILGTMLATTNNLTYIETDDSAGANNGTGIYAGLMWAIDASAFYAGPLFNTYVPDDNFEQALIDLGYDSTLDNYVASSTINGVFSLDISNKNISDLTGIGGFNNLNILTCNSNNIQTLDLSHNANLTTVNANFNQIENLFVQNCTSLDYFSVENNSLTDLNVTQNTLLEELYCSSNQLTTIDTSQNTLLTNFYCSSNSLVSLDVTQNTLLTIFTCNQNQLTSLDVTQNTMLTSFQCSNNSLTNLDVTQNTLIFYLNSSNNLLSSLDVSQNTALNILECSTNNLTSLDVTLNVDLITLKVFTNSFEFIDLKQNSLLTQFVATNIAELSCIQVANETDANAGSGIYASWINTTAASYSEFCSDFYTYIPDNNFEQALINLGYDSTLDDYVLTSNIESLTSLNINGQSISDLTGIEDFIALENLQCGNNNLSTLDITQNVNLLNLRCYQNSLTSLDVTQNSLLTDLRCGTNSITNLDISQNTALTSLRVQNNSLSNLDITLNTALEILYIYNNNITEINVTNLTNLLSFWCYENLLQRLDVTSNTALTSLRCYDNNITALDLVQNTLLTTMNATLSTNLTCVQVLDATAATANTGIYTTWLKDAGATYSTNCNYPEETYIPDDNFEQALIDLGYDTILDNFVETANINTISTLDVAFKSISDLTGVEAFVALTDLDCRFNQLNSLDISLNTALTNLSCLNNQLTSLNISQNVALTSFDCSSNLLTAINVSSNIDLIYFYCNDNLITSLDVTQHPALNSLRCQSNQITNIDVSQNTVLETLVCNDNLLTTLDVSVNIGLRNLYCSINQITDLDISLNPLMAYFECSSNELTSLNVKNGVNTNFLSFNTLNNTNLTCINVDDVAYSTVNWTDIDAQTSFSEGCSNINTYIPDNNFEQALIDLGYDTVLDDYVLTANIEPITSLDVSGKSISDLTGIEAFIALTSLTCTSNQLISLDLTQNTALTTLNCAGNQLSSLNITQNIELDFLSCALNQITSLDLSQNTVLTTLVCGYNQLTTLDVSSNPILKVLNFNGNQITSLDLSQNIVLASLFCNFNQLATLNLSSNPSLGVFDCSNNQLTNLTIRNGNNTSFTIFNTTNNPDLICIEVDDVTYSTINWTNIDTQTSFSEDCSNINTYIPDNNFEQALIDLGYDTVLDDYVLTANIEPITSLDVSGKSISDLTGIEAFVALTDLNCFDNQLTSLNVSQNIALTTLNCGNNLLTFIDIDSNTDLIDFNCNNNLITSLNITQNTALNGLRFQSNQITNIDVSQNTTLETILCDDNLLTAIDVSSNPILKALNFNGNQITSLDLSQNVVLASLFCNFNQLATLNLSSNPSLGVFDCSNNQLTNLTIRNGNNTSFTIFNTTNNPDLICIEVDDITYSTVNWTNIDTQTSFSEDCSTLSVDKLDLDAAISVYPNPTSTILSINSKLALKKLELYTVLGRKVLDTNSKIINMSELQSGVYFLKIYSENNIITKKVIKK